MENVKHTPGEWKVEAEEHGLHLIWNKEKEIYDLPILIARTCYAIRSEANAKLMAASPDMLEALNKCIAALEYAAFNLDGTTYDDVSNSIIESTSPSRTAIIAARQAKAAIAKATL